MRGVGQENCVPDRKVCRARWTPRGRTDPRERAMGFPSHSRVDGSRPQVGRSLVFAERRLFQPETNAP